MLKLNKIDTEKIDNISLKEWAEMTTHDPLVHLLLFAISRANTYVPYPELYLAGPAIRQLQRTFNGNAFYISEGWGTLIEDLKHQAELVGVTIMNHRKVIEVKYDRPVQRVLFTNGDILEVSFVIVTAGLKETCNLVYHAEHTSLKRWENQARSIHGTIKKLTHSFVL